MFRPRCLLVSALSCAAVALPAAAQKYIPKTIVFSGTALNQSELLKVSGLRPGAQIGQPDIQAAAQKLLDTGLFSDIRFSFDGAELRYMLTPSTNLVPAAYVNFPWWDTATLNAAVEAKVPLFNGTVPPESGLEQQVTDALTSLVAEKGVQANILAVPARDLQGHRSVAFRIVSPPIQVASVSFAGVDPGMAGRVAAVAQAAANQDLDPSTEATLAVALQVIYHRQGYLQMQMGGLEQGAPQVAGGRVLVPLTAKIDAGPQYRVGAIGLAAGSMISDADFAPMCRLHPGDVANEDLLHETLAEVSGAYKSRGYMDAKVDAPPALDAASHTVRYTIAVEPGPIYHLGKVTFTGIDDQQRAEITRAWPLHEGDIYDARQVAGFLVTHRNSLHSLDGWSASYKAYAHPDTHIVDLEVVFQQGGPLR